MDRRALAVALNSAIVRYLQESSDDGFHTYDVGEYYPHDIGHCPLRLYYVYTVMKSSPLDERGLMNTTAGSLAHGLVQPALHRLGYEIEKPFELALSKDVRIRGRVDAYWPGGELPDDPLADYVAEILGSRELPPHVIEIKSVGRKGRFLPAEPYDTHKLQLSMYLYGLDADFGLFIYVSRVDFGRRFYVLERSEELYRRAVLWVMNLHNSIVSRTPPEPRPAFPQECDSCPLMGVCSYAGGQQRLFE